MSEVLTTPYEEAKELLASGASADTIAARLQSRGLDVLGKAYRPATVQSPYLALPYF